MRLKHITFTGIDAKTDIQDLIDIQREFPIVEFGVLTSYRWYENGNLPHRRVWQSNWN